MLGSRRRRDCSTIWLTHERFADFAYVGCGGGVCSLYIKRYLAEDVVRWIVSPFFLSSSFQCSFEALLCPQDVMWPTCKAARQHHRRTAVQVGHRTSSTLKDPSNAASGHPEDPVRQEGVTLHFVTLLSCVIIARALTTAPYRTSMVPTVEEQLHYCTRVNTR